MRSEEGSNRAMMDAYNEALRKKRGFTCRDRGHCAR